MEYDDDREMDEYVRRLEHRRHEAVLSTPVDEMSNRVGRAAYEASGGTDKWYGLAPQVRLKWIRIALAAAEAAR